MGLKSYFLDTYALYEIIVGNPRYKVYEKVKIITTRLNLMELYYRLARHSHKEIAKKYYDYFSDYIVDIDDVTIQEAMDFRIVQNKRKNLSYVDCIGYMIARKNMIKFLTGDKEFEHMEEVEYVK